jgi:hypothetical protein
MDGIDLIQCLLQTQFLSLQIMGETHLCCPRCRSPLWKKKILRMEKGEMTLEKVEHARVDVRWGERGRRGKKRRSTKKEKKRKKAEQRREGGCEKRKGY